MGKYTSLPPRLERKIENDLETITEIIAKEIDPISVMLFGSFGKGEGSIVGTIPFNDYDLYVVTKKKLPDNIMEDIGIMASKAINKGGMEFIERSDEIYDVNNFFHVDLRCLEYNKLHKLPMTTRTYEIKNSTILLHGRDLRSVIKITEKDIPLSEGIRHIINKSCLLLLSMDSRRLNGGFRKDEKKIAIYYALKTYLACAEIFIISAGKFAGTYTKRNIMFKELYGRQFPDIAKKVNFATKMKLNLKFDEINDPIELWKDARDTLFETLKYISNKHFNIESKDKRDIMKLLHKKLPRTYFSPYIPFGKLLFPAQYILNLKFFKRTGHWRTLLTWKDAGLSLLMPAFLLLFAMDDKSLLPEIKKYMKTIAHVNGDTWDSYREGLLYAYGKYYTQKML